MNDPVRVGPWVQVKQGVTARHYANSEKNPAMASYDDLGWTIWADATQGARVMVHGEHTGDEGKRRADAVADALGWILERDPATEPPPGPNRVRDAAVIAEIMAERERAYAKWGPQPYPWTCYEDEDINGLHDIAERLERVARDAMAERAAKGLPPTRAQIVAEEAGEALREIDPKRARKELVQLAAMAIAALSECPDLRKKEQP